MQEHKRLSGDVLADGARIGTFTSTGVDDGMAVMFAAFEPSAEYASVAPLFRAISDATAEGQALSDKSHARPEALNIRLRTSDGRPVPTDWIMIYDYGDDLERTLDAKLLTLDGFLR